MKEIKEQWDRMEISTGDGIDHEPPRRRSSVKMVLAAVGSAFILFLLSLRTVKPAHCGIVVTMGAVSDTTLESGVHVTNPFASVVQLNLKTQIVYSENIVPTQEGLNVELDVSLLYHLERSSARSLYLKLGELYEEVLILPELQSAVRGLTSEVSAKALYTSGRTEIHDKLAKELKEKLEPRGHPSLHHHCTITAGIVMEDVLLKGIKLPKQLTDAIELKAKAEQESARMEFVLTKAEQEAKRKKVEASGISAFQKIVSEGISTQLLQRKGIEATEKLAQSTNSKIVVMGNTQNSLPVLLSHQGGPNAP